MLVPEVKIDRSDLEKITRSVGILKSCVKKETSEFPRICGIKYYDILLSNINSGKHMEGFQYGRTAGSRRYVEWKKKFGAYDKGFWRLTDDLMRAIKNQRFSTGYLVGIRAGVKDSGGKSWLGSKDNPKGKPKHIAMYARTLEFGNEDQNKSGYHPPRPMFGPALEDFISMELKQMVYKTMIKMSTTWK